MSKAEPNWAAIQATVAEPPKTLTSSELVTQAIKGSRGDQQQAIADAGLELIAMLLRKNQDYGSSVFDSPMLLPNVTANMAIRVRMSDKLKRIIQLSSNPALVESESLDDTLDDFAAYRIIERALEIMQRETIKLPG